MMDRNDILEDIRNTLISVLKHEDFDMRDEMTAADVNGWDSLSHITIISEIEEKFGLRFKLKELNKLKNMGTMVDLVQSKL
jgi:acyl carrier protein